MKKTKESKTVGPARAPGALACPRSAHFSSNPPQVGRRLPAQGANKRRGIAVALVFLYFFAPLARVFCRALPKAEARFCRGASIDAALRAIFFGRGLFRTPPPCGIFVSALTNDFLGTSRKKRNDAQRALNRQIGPAVAVFAALPLHFPLHSPLPFPLASRTRRAGSARIALSPHGADKSAWRRSGFVVARRWRSGNGAFCFRLFDSHGKEWFS